MSEFAEESIEIERNQQALLRMLPGVDHMLERSKSESFIEGIPRTVVVRSIRTAIESLRSRILKQDPSVTESLLSEASVMEKVRVQIEQFMIPNLRRTINATGVVIHTNLGRSLLAPEAIENLQHIAGRYSNLEFDLDVGKRGSRYRAVEDLLCEISGASAAMVVNNNAGAVLLSLDTLAKGKTVIVSRGELVEIGGSFRIPDVMAKSGCILKEVGTTNRTHLRDYEQAIDENTALLLKVHTSNYAMVGFTASVSLKELSALSAQHRIPVMEDLGSGMFIDFSKYGMMKEPTVQESLNAGADLVTFSGDKLLGGPQAGIIVGNQELISRIRQNPLTRALRIDKLTLAALESTLRLYRDPEMAVKSIPTLRMLTCPIEEIEPKAQRLADELMRIGDSRLKIERLNLISRVGGGALPLQELPSRCVGIRITGMSVNTVEKAFRNNLPPIIGRIEQDYVMIDLRTVADDEVGMIATAVQRMLKQ